METDKTEFLMRDLNSAAYLMLHGYQIAGVKSMGKVIFWRFNNKDTDDEDTVNEILHEYINGKAVGNIKQFAANQKTLKQMIYSDY